MNKELYNTRIIRKQFKGMANLMKSILSNGDYVEGPIRIALTDDEGNHVLTLTLEKKPT